MRCPNCGNENPDDYTFCDECGARLTPQEGEAEAAGTPEMAAATGVNSAAAGSPEPAPAASATVCPSCGAPIVPGEAYCNECGAELAVTPAAQPDGGQEAASGPPPVQPYMGDASDATLGTGHAGQQPHEEVPVTDDTMQAPSAPQAYGAEGPMPGVTPIEEEGAPAPVPAAAPQPSHAEGSVEWAGHALSQLEEAQKSMAGGDWVAYGQTMSGLKSFLESVVQGNAPDMEHAMQTVPASSTAAPAPEATQPAPYVPEAPDQAVEPAAEAGSLGVEPAPYTGANGMARLVVIASGAELPLPQQEEITVGREDPSSGIFPDIDLTPYGGEDGGVSRRHARLLHLANDYFVEDLQSTNYTKLDGQRLPARVREKLEDGARLDFGRVAVIFRKS